MIKTFYLLVYTIFERLCITVENMVLRVFTCSPFLLGKGRMYFRLSSILVLSALIPVLTIYLSFHIFESLALYTFILLVIVWSLGMMDVIVRYTYIIHQCTVTYFDALYKQINSVSVLEIDDREKAISILERTGALLKVMMPASLTVEDIHELFVYDLIIRFLLDFQKYVHKCALSNIPVDSLTGEGI